MKQLIVIGATALLATVTLLPGKVEAKSVCYQWSTFTDRFTLDVKKQTRLTSKAEEDEGHARQTAYSVHGKLVGWCGDDTMVAVTGTVITAAPRPSTTGQTGAHLGLEIHASRGDGFPEGVESCRSGDFDCTTSEVSSTPDVWNCQSRNEFDDYHGDTTLTQVDPREDPLCGFFEDGASTDQLSASGITAPAAKSGGGLRR